MTQLIIAMPAKSTTQKYFSGMGLLPPIILCFSALGCGGSQWEAATHPASGQVFVDNAPAVGAVVELHSLGDPPDIRNSRPWGIVDKDGTFSLSTYDKGDGAPVGDYAITLRWPPENAGPSLADQLGGRFASSVNSKWKTSIVAGRNEIQKIEINGVKLPAANRGQKSSEAPPLAGRPD